MNSLLIAIEAFGAIVAALYGCTLLIQSWREEFNAVRGIRAGRRWQMSRGW